MKSITISRVNAGATDLRISHRQLRVGVKRVSSISPRVARLELTLDGVACLVVNNRTTWSGIRFTEGQTGDRLNGADSGTRYSLMLLKIGRLMQRYADVPVRF